MMSAGVDGAAFPQVPVGIAAGEIRAAQTDAIHDPSQRPPQRLTFRE
jgi:hypothetical protein